MGACGSKTESAPAERPPKREPEKAKAQEGQEKAQAPEPAPADDAAAEPEPARQPSLPRPQSVDAGPKATQSITITERPFGFGAMSGQNWVGAQTSSIKSEKWNDLGDGTALKSGLYFETITQGDGEPEDVRYMNYRDISNKLKTGDLPLKITFWAGPEIHEAWEEVLDKYDVNEDGLISWEEFQKMSSTLIGMDIFTGHGISEEELHQHFSNHADEKDLLHEDEFKLLVAELTNDWKDSDKNPINFKSE